MRSASKHFDVRKAPRFYDPFCGSGTIALAALVEGFRVSGSDILYPSVIIAKAKLSRLGLSDCEAISAFSDRLSLSHCSQPLDIWPNWEIWYVPRVLRALQDIREEIMEREGGSYFPHLMASLFQTAWDLSAADKRIIVPTRSKYSPSAPNILPDEVAQIFSTRVDRILRAQMALRALGVPVSSPPIWCGSSIRDTTWPVGIDVLLTSPPYGCGIDYRRAMRLQSRFCGMWGAGQEEPSEVLGRIHYLGDVRDSLPREILRGTWYRKVHEKSPGRLRAFLQYLHDIDTFLKIAKTRLSPTGLLGLVVGPPEIGRVRVPLQEIVKILALRRGFEQRGRMTKDQIRARRQNLPLRSASSPIPEEYLIPLGLS